MSCTDRIELCPFAEPVDVTIEQGATWIQGLVWKSGATVSSATAVDLTGYTASAMFRLDLEDASPAASIGTAVGGITLGGTAGAITMFLTASQTTGLTAGAYSYDLLLTSGITKYRLLSGIATVVRAATR
jgi:hypothetical protein